MRPGHLQEIHWVFSGTLNVVPFGAQDEPEAHSSREAWLDREVLVAWLLHALEQGQQLPAIVACLFPLLQLCIKARPPCAFEPPGPFADPSSVTGTRPLLYAPTGPGAVPGACAPAAGPLLQDPHHACRQWAPAFRA